MTNKEKKKRWNPHIQINQINNSLQENTNYEKNKNKIVNVT